jgi:hypothetical protein
LRRPRRPGFRPWLTAVGGLRPSLPLFLGRIGGRRPTRVGRVLGQPGCESGQTGEEGPHDRSPTEGCLLPIGDREVKAVRKRGGSKAVAPDALSCGLVSISLSQNSVYVSREMLRKII